MDFIYNEEEKSALIYKSKKIISVNKYLATHGKQSAIHKSVKIFPTLKMQQFVNKHNNYNFTYNPP